MPVGKGASASNLAGPRRSSDATLSESEARNEGSAPKPTDGKQIYRSIYAGVVREKAKKTKHERDSFGLADYRSTVAPNEWLHRGTFDKRFALLSGVCYRVGHMQTTETRAALSPMGLGPACSRQIRARSHDPQSSPANGQWSHQTPETNELRGRQCR